MTDIMEKTSRKDLHTAITELILGLKGDGTVSSIQKRTGVHRNMLTAIFEVYDAKMRGDEVRTKSKSNPRIKNLYWGTNSLITVADTLGIRVSEFIRAAEDVQDGLPPWFERRISCDVAPRSAAELVHVFLEALGCFSYAAPFPSTEPKKKARHYHKKDASESFASTCASAPFSDGEVSDLKSFFFGCLLDYSELMDFKMSYCSENISRKDAYRILRNAVDEVIGETRGMGGNCLLERLRIAENKLVNEIRNGYRGFPQEKGNNLARTQQEQKKVNCIRHVICKSQIVQTSKKRLADVTDA